MGNLQDLQPGLEGRQGLISQEQADTAKVFHDTAIAPCGGKKSNRWRRAGKTKRWVRAPERFVIPVKFGLYDYSNITDLDTDTIHAEEDCPSI